MFCLSLASLSLYHAAERPFLLWLWRTEELEWTDSSVYCVPLVLLSNKDLSDQGTCSPSSRGRLLQHSQKSYRSNRRLVVVTLDLDCAELGISRMAGSSFHGL